ncbi:hypothetical protein J6590_015605 [Homalodisca vitripennis]|nr:hypothetical protein J6590_015605 [Homalodisca vitripennis]
MKGLEKGMYYGDQAQPPRRYFPYSFPTLLILTHALLLFQCAVQRWRQYTMSYDIACVTAPLASVLSRSKIARCGKYQVFRAIVTSEKLTLPQSASSRFRVKTSKWREKWSFRKTENTITQPKE